MNLNILNFKNLTNKVKFVDGNELNTNFDRIDNDLNDLKRNSKMHFYDATIEGNEDYKNKLRLLDGSENSYLYYVKHFSDFYDYYNIHKNHLQAVAAIYKAYDIFDNIENNSDKTDADKYWLFINDAEDDDNRYEVIFEDDTYYINIENTNQFAIFFKDLHNYNFINKKSTSVSINTTNTIKIVVKLLTDIDLNGKIWLPINYDGNHNGFNSKISTITIIGNESQKEINNLIIKNILYSRYTGFFCTIGDSTKLIVKNITFNSPIVYSEYACTGLLAGGYSSGKFECDTMNVFNATIMTADNPGLVLGLIESDSGSAISVTVKNCTFDNNLLIWLRYKTDVYAPSHQTYNGLVEVYTTKTDCIIDDGSNTYNNLLIMSIADKNYTGNAGKTEFFEMLAEFQQYRKLILQYCEKNKINCDYDNLGGILPEHDYDLMFVTKSLDNTNKLVFSF